MSINITLNFMHACIESYISELTVCYSVLISSTNNFRHRHFFHRRKRDDNYIKKIVLNGKTMTKMLDMDDLGRHRVRICPAFVVT